MSVEATTIHITEAIRDAARYTAATRPRRYRGSHRRTNTDAWALWGIGACLAVGLAGYGWLTHLIGAW